MLTPVKEGVMLIEAVSSNVTRFCIARDKETVINHRSCIGIEKVTKHGEQNGERSGEDLTCSVSPQTGVVTWKWKGNIFLTQQWPELVNKKVMRWTSDGAATERVKTVDGERSVVSRLTAHEDREAWGAKVFLTLRDGELTSHTCELTSPCELTSHTCEVTSPCEVIHGMGQGEDGIYNYRGSVHYLYQHNMRTPMPVIISSCHYGILFDCGCLMTFYDEGNTESAYMELDTVDVLDYYVIYGEQLDTIITSIRALTGRAPLLPRWAFGYIQSKEAYRTQDEVIETAGEYRKRHIPLDGIVQDWNTWEPGKWGNKQVDKQRYPALAAMNRCLHEIHVHSMVSVWPNMAEGSADHDEFAAAGKLLADNSTYNAFDEKAREIYWKQAERCLFRGGFDSWWCDSTEPFSAPDWQGEKRLPEKERFALVGGEHKKYIDSAAANCYALMHAKGMYENQRRATNEKRVFNLTRSGWAGIQRYGAVLWSGDTSARWDVLRAQITEGLNMAMSGIPWWTLDAGGFFTVRDKYENRGCGMANTTTALWFWNGDYNDGVKDAAYRELYVRWLQLACFLPIFRSHGTDTPREIWQFGEAGTPHYDAIETCIRLRYRLLPYIYSLAASVHFDNATMMRSLLFDFASDTTACGLHDQYMFGPSILVCPVTEAGAAARRLYLPKGASWYNFWTRERHEGGQWIETPSPLDRIPLFVRAGSVIPMEGDLLESSEDVSAKPLEIHVYGGADGSFALYEDEGDGYAYEQGVYNRILFAWDDATRTLSTEKPRYDFPASVKKRGWVMVKHESAAE